MSLGVPENHLWLNTIRELHQRLLNWMSRCMDNYWKDEDSPDILMWSFSGVCFFFKVWEFEYINPILGIIIIYIIYIILVVGLTYRVKDNPPKKEGLVKGLLKDRESWWLRTARKALVLGGNVALPLRFPMKFARSYFPKDPSGMYCWLVNGLFHPYIYIHPGRITWNLRIHPCKRKIIFQTIIFRFYVNLRGCK